MSLLSELDGLDRERPEQPFTVRVAGQVITCRDPRELSWRDLVDGLHSLVGFVRWIAPDEAAAMLLAALPLWKMQAVVAAYRRHYGLPASVREDGRLLMLMGRPQYRRAIEWDLHALHHLDLTTEWQARRWRRLMDFIDALPNHSHYAEQLAADEELAEVLLDQDDGSEKKPVRRLSEFTPEVELLSTLADRVGDLIQVTVASSGGKARKVTPQPRPVGAIEKVRLRRRAKRHDWTVARVYGRIGPETRPPK
ncbi:hypothetical protein [Actinoplanes sp. URMC 104]|uniref:hypothetical protein n=1 Tax=Actinoplanes sp. URMC 104 TaxID=3423409 RepID=UPI003F1CE6D1